MKNSKSESSLTIKEGKSKGRGKTNAKKDKVKKPPLKLTKFGMWCKDRRLTQDEIKERTYVSYGCIRTLWHEIKSNDGTIHHIFLAYKDELAESGINTFQQLRKMVRTLVDVNIEYKEVKQ